MVRLGIIGIRLRVKARGSFLAPQTYNARSCDSKSRYISSYGVPKRYTFGLSMAGPGRRTAEPVPADITRKAASLLVSARASKD